jgi:S1-C subfamily serine protease
VVCRGNFTASKWVGQSVVLVDGDVDLSDVDELVDGLIRATGKIIPPKNKLAKLKNMKLEEGVKDATAPYKFFELSDVGLSCADDEEGLVVTGVKAGTPFGDCGLEKGDLIVALDDAPAGRSGAFRKLVRRTLVRQGDGLLTVVRGNKTIDLPVFFPLPK